MERLGRLLILGCTAALLAACGESREVPPDVRVRVVNAAATHPTLAFQREQRVEATMLFREAGAFSFDADTYDFNISANPPGLAISETLATFTETLTANNDYYMVIAEASGVLELLLAEQPAFPADASDAEITFVHAAETFRDVDVFVEPSGADLSAATPIGQASFREVLPPVTRATGDYRLYLTEAGNASAVLLESAFPTLVAASTNMFVLTSGAGQGTAEIVVVYTGATTTALLVDGTARSGVRFVNTVSDRAARNVYLDGDFATALVAGLGYGAVSDYVSMSAAVHTLSVTPADNVGSIELEHEIATSPGRVFSMLIAGSGGNVVEDTVLDDRRPVFDRAKMQIVNGTSLYGGIEVFLLLEGETADSVLADVRSFGPFIHQLEPAPEDYTLVVRQESTDTVLAGPLPLTLNGGGVYGILLLDAADAVTVDVVLYDDFP